MGVGSRERIGSGTREDGSDGRDWVVRETSTTLTVGQGLTPSDPHTLRKGWDRPNMVKPLKVTFLQDDVGVTHE